MTKYNEKLLHLNDDAVETLIPVIFYITLLMTIGLIGNPIVIFFYGFKLPATPSHVFIVSLAVFDSLTCFISMPLELVDVIRFYIFESVGACKMLRFIGTSASISSGLTLVAIAVVRYRKICQPLKKQINLKTSRIVIVLATITSLLISWPAAVFNDVVEVTVAEVHHLIGYDCTTRREESYKNYITTYNAICFLVFAMALVTITILYSIIGRKLYKLRKFHSLRRRELELSKANSVYSFDQCKGESTNDTIEDSIVITNYSHTRGEKREATSLPRFRRKTLGQALHSRKYTLVMFIISVAFLLSFLPHLVLVTWRTITTEYEPNLMSKSELVAFQIAIRSYLISSACNPIIYGFLNTEFKQFISHLFCICLKRIRNKASTDGQNIKSQDSS